MLILTILAYILIGVAELWLWSERPWPKVLAYLSALLVAATLEILVTLELPLPQPLGVLMKWVGELWPGGG